MYVKHSQLVYVMPVNGALSSYSEANYTAMCARYYIDLQTVSPDWTKYNVLLTFSCICHALCCWHTVLFFCPRLSNEWLSFHISQYCLSGHPTLPCNVLKFKSTTIMLDCGLDTTSALNFLPLPLVHRWATGLRGTAFIHSLIYPFIHLCMVE